MRCWTWPGCAVRARALAWALALGCVPTVLGAYGGTMQDGLGGTLTWDTVPQEEADLALWGLGGDGRPALGPGARVGLTDQLQASARWFKALDGQPDRSELGLVLREAYFPDHRPALALIARAPYDGTAWHPRGGLLLQVEPFDSCLTLNAEGGLDGWDLHLGFWTPYLAAFTRLAAELAWSQDSRAVFTPQLLLNGPGDISLALGCGLGLADGAVGWSLRLSYDLSPNP